MHAIIDGVIRRSALLPVLLLLTSVVSARQWPEFRGPDGQGHSTEKGVPLDWSESRNILWKTPVPGSGWSSPVVGGGRVWLTTAVENRDGGRARGLSLRAMAFDAATGREVVNVEVVRIERPGHDQHQEQPRLPDTHPRR